jgi:hypothetical protein
LLRPFIFEERNQKGNHDDTYCDDDVIPFLISSFRSNPVRGVRRKKGHLLPGHAGSARVLTRSLLRVTLSSHFSSRRFESKLHAAMAFKKLRPFVVTVVNLCGLFWDDDNDPLYVEVSRCLTTCRCAVLQHGSTYLPTTLR